jgi:N-methylhydantoinase A/oxoprolinase/acetone carboxylase beta subunit
MQYSLGIDAGGTYTDAVLIRNNWLFLDISIAQTRYSSFSNLN